MADTTASPSKPFLLEVVTDTAQGLRAAADNGADRIELCAGLSAGGLTPSRGLMLMAARAAIPVRAMIRPRAGDFTYCADEIDMMRHDIDTAAACGLSGVVFGVNLTSGALDKAAMTDLTAHAQSQGLEVAIHRSFDLTPDPFEALETCVALRLKTILTSGGPRFAADGIAGLARLVTAARGRIEILAGSGVTAENAPDIVRGSGVSSLHASCWAPVFDRSDIADDRAAALGYVSAAQKDTAASLVAGMRQTLDGINLSLGKLGPPMSRQLLGKPETHLRKRL